jgi:Tol biopolymer transport system component
MVARGSVRLGVLGAVVALGGCAFVTGATRSSTGEQANFGVSSGPSISATGRYVAFDSEATNLVPGDTNGVADVFVRDLAAGTTERVSVASDGTQANGPSTAPKISRDGRFVVFKSDATNLVPGDTNGVTDVFVHDRVAHTTVRVSVASDGTQANAVSSLFASPNIDGDGYIVVFVSDASNLVAGDTHGTAHTYTHDLLTGRTEMADVASDGTHGNGFAGGNASISNDGRYVAFDSAASNLVPGDNGTGGVFVHDRSTGHTERVDVASDGTQANDNALDLGTWISGNGRYVSFRSFASNLVPGDTNGTTDAFVHDRLTGQTERVSVASGGAQANGEQDTHVSDASISDDGRFVLFDSFATDLVPGDTNGSEDVFVHDRATGRTSRVSVAADGSQGDSASGNSQISGDGRYAAYGTVASNLIPNDTNGTYDIAVGFTARPEVDQIAPSRLTRGAHGVTVTVSGAWFMPDARLLLGPGIQIGNVRVHAASIVASVDVATDAPTGPHDVDVANPGSGPGSSAGAAGTCPSCLTIQP